LSGLARWYISVGEYLRKTKTVPMFCGIEGCVNVQNSP